VCGWSGDVLEALMAERERLGDLTQRRARKMQTADGGVVVSPRVRRMLEREAALA
jgi:hypothetical protein